jgi:H+-transporting ATPase
MGEKIYTSEMIEQLDYHQEIGSDATSLVEIADGFAQVFPEHKYNIVRRLQKRGWIVGMTGDGVNDAPALSLADIGIAVAGSSDAARAAADIVLTESGLSVIVAAIIQARKIFQRMRNYCMYSITSVTRIVLTFGILSISYNWFFPTVAIVILAILNDLSMLSVSRDRVKPSKRPDEWDFVELFTIALVLGGWLTLSSVVLFLIIFQTNFFPSAFHLPQLNFTTVRGLMYLQVSASGLATIFVTRSHGFSWRERPGVSVVLAFVVAQAVASVLGAYGLGGFPHNGITDFGGAGWGWVLLGWIWVIIWYIPMDFLKFLVRIIRRGFFPWAKKHHLLGGKKLRRHKKHAEDETIQKRGATTTAAPPRK